MDGIEFEDSIIEAGFKKLAKVEIRDAGLQLTDSENRVVELLRKASKALDYIFMEQMCPLIIPIAEELKRNTDAISKKRLEYIMFNKSPWDALDNLKPFIKGSGICKSIAVYPEGITQEGLEKAIKNNEISADVARDYYTAIKMENGKLRALKYSDAYKTKLEKAALIIDEAAEASDNESLKAYLKATAKAFRTNDYTEQQLLWLKLDSKIEPTIGPFETYEDKVFGYKGFFESYINIRNEAETKKLQVYAKYLKEIDASLPISSDFEFTRKDQSNSPITVVDEIDFGGEANAGFVTSAFNLPNDDRIRAKSGSKKVLMKNIIGMKFEYLSNPVAQNLVDKSQLAYMDRDSIMDFVLFHELSHGLGAGELIMESNKIPVSVLLKDMFSHIEEARADVTGVYCAIYLKKKGLVEKYGNDFMKKFYVSYLAANLLRGMRMGLKEAHAMGQAIEYNFLKEKGGIYFNEKTDRFGIDMDRIEKAMLEIVKELNDIEASGDYERAKRLTEKYCRITEELEAAYKSINHLPVEIFPIIDIGKANVR
jgi:hypothetical protein